MRQRYLRDAQPGDILEDVFVLANKQFAAGSNGKHYIKGFISDKSQQVTARMWNASRELFNALPDNGFLKARCRVENYQGNTQVIIEAVWPAKEGSFDMGDLMPMTTRDIPEMFAKLKGLVLGVRNRHLRALMEAYFADTKLMNEFQKAPAAQTFHHAFLGGLLEHTLNAVEVADAICRFYPGLNRDVVVAGVFVHDLAKTWELKYETAFGYTDCGQLVGHVVKGAMWIEQKAEAAAIALGEEIPQCLIDVMQHIVLSHHGLPEHGAARTPSTPEAIAVHTIENLDAKLMMSLGATRGEASANADGNWTEYMKAFSGRLYRPDVAPPDDDAADASEFGGAVDDVESPAMPTVKLAITNPLFESMGKKQ
ncbi:MAG TPA: HD domain-containing protein [Tepidisphaeraceae bacterium]|jgi:3'-5' exoribonuclease|nr:HD domain-containing protein [Tepidisphaeraceae bacterium]